jgi:hypothetical protein
MRFIIEIISAGLQPFYYTSANGAAHGPVTQATGSSGPPAAATPMPELTTIPPAIVGHD